jgi:hypothetical protein
MTDRLRDKVTVVDSGVDSIGHGIDQRRDCERFR